MNLFLLIPVFYLTKGTFHEVLLYFFHCILKDCTSPKFDCLKCKLVTLWSEFFHWFLPLVLYLYGNSESKFIYYNYLFQISGIFFVWENYKFTDFYTTPHSFYLFTLLYGKILSWRYVYKYIIYIHMQLCYIMQNMWYYAMLYYI